MMKLLVLIAALLFFLSVEGQVRVKGYTRKDGTYVAPYTRSSPNSSPYDNYSYPGNTNPYTGKTATGNPETYINNLYKNNSTPKTSDVWVEGYYRKDGTYVKGHYRSAPNGNVYDNYSYPGNTNPYTRNTATGNIIGTLRTNYSAKLKDRPDVLGNIIGLIPENTPVEVVGRENEFWKIIYNGKIGYSHELYFEKKIEAPYAKKNESAEYKNIENYGNSQTTEEFFNIGIEKSIMKDYQTSIEYFNKALGLDSNFFPALLGRASSKFQLKDYLGAIQDYNEIISKNPLFEDAFIGKGLVYFQIGNYFESIKDFTNAIDINKNSSEAYFYRGRSKFNNNDYFSAIADFSKSIEFNPSLIKAYHYRAFSKIKSEDYYGAIDDCSSYINVDPKNKDVYILRGISKIFLGQKESGCLDLSKAGELGDVDAYELIKKYCN